MLTTKGKLAWLILSVVMISIYHPSPTWANLTNFRRSQDMMIDFMDKISMLGNGSQDLSKVCTLAESCKRRIINVPSGNSKYRKIKSCQIEFLDDVCNFSRQRASQKILMSASSRLYSAMKKQYPATCSISRSDMAMCCEKIVKIYRVAFSGKQGGAVSVPRTDIRKLRQRKNIPERVGILPASTHRRLTESDLAGYSAFDLNIIRNEIYARHGRSFIKAVYRDYFRRQPWYEENSKFQDSWLSSIEKGNAAFIAAYQKKYGLE